MARLIYRVAKPQFHLIANQVSFYILTAFELHYFPSTSTSLLSHPLGWLELLHCIGLQFTINRIFIHPPDLDVPLIKQRIGLYLDQWIVGNDSGIGVCTT